MDLTAIAHKHGWERIAAYDEEDYSWKFDTLGTEYWHYQRTDGLTWYAAMQEIYPEETLQQGYTWEKCQELGIGEDVLLAKGIPTPTATPSP